MEVKPWYKRVEGPFPAAYGCVGVKMDGGGSMRGRGLVGRRVIHQAVANHDEAAIIKAVEAGEDVNEVEAAGNTPLHIAAYEGWVAGAELLLKLGAKLNPSNNAGDRPYHWAENMRQTEMMAFLDSHGADKTLGKVLVPEHVPKVKDFYDKDPDHPKPSAEWLAAKKAEDDAGEAERNRLVPGY